MPYWKAYLAMCTIAVVGAAAPVYSQSPPAAATAPTAPSAPGVDKTPSAPSADTLKRAKSVGLRPEARKNGTVYCWEDATVGTRFTTKKCVDADQLSDMIAQREAQQDKMRTAAGAK